MLFKEKPDFTKAYLQEDNPKLFRPTKFLGKE